MTKKYRADIDGLRAVAVTAVVLYHTGVPGFSGGFTGVDIFFVISGYLITQILYNGATSPDGLDLYEFYIRRARRLLPALYTVVITTSIISLFTLTPLGELQSLSTSAIATIFYASNFYFRASTGGYFDSGAESQPLLHTWSLSAEEQFYFVWPPVILSVHTFLRHYIGPIYFRLILITVAAALLLGSLILCAYATPGHAQFSFYLLPTRMWEFMSGALLGIASIKKVKVHHFFYHPTFTSAARAFGLLLIAAAVGFYDEDTVFPGVAALLPTAGALFVLAAGSNDPMRASHSILGNRVAVFVGLLSYGWYLWHWPLLVLTRSYFFDDGVLWRDFLVSTAAFILAFVTYKIIEHPLRYGQFSLLSKRRAVLGSAALASLVVAGISLIPFIIGESKLHRPPFDELLAAQQDTPHAVSDPCFDAFSFDDTESSTDGCPSPSTTRRPSPAFIAWGDSHASMWSPAFQAYSSNRQQSWYTYSLADCPPLLELDYKKSGCFAHNLKFLSALKDKSFNSRIKGIVIAARWSNYSEAVPVGKHSVSVTKDPSSRIEPANTIELGLREVLKLAHASDLNVLLIGPGPEFNWFIPNCLAKRRYDRCALARAEGERKRTDVWRTLLDLAEGYENVRVWDPFTALCTVDKCEATKSGEILWVDDNHLTHSAAGQFWINLAPALDWITKR